MMTFKITGLTELQWSLDALQRRIQSLSGPVPFEDLFPPEFMRRYTDFKTIDEMLAASGHEVQSQEDFDSVPEAELDSLVAARTRFQSWDAMKAKAGEEYAARRMDVGSL